MLALTISLIHGLTHSNQCTLPVATIALTQSNQCTIPVAPAASRYLRSLGRIYVWGVRKQILTAITHAIIITTTPLVNP